MKLQKGFLRFTVLGLIERLVFGWQLSQEKYYLDIPSPILEQAEINGEVCCFVHYTGKIYLIIMLCKLMKYQINLQYGHSQPFREQFPPGPRSEQCSCATHPRPPLGAIHLPAWPLQSGTNSFLLTPLSN